VISLSRLISVQTLPLWLTDNGWRALHKLRLSVGVRLRARPNGTWRRIKSARRHAMRGVGPVQALATSQRLGRMRSQNNISNRRQQSQGGS
jgi:hypothetical protein